ncbi:MAG: LPXTG cell wall anchor domain-containing protein [Burkholderiaceae bacterium]|nr:LPXTG cell wall anchor domain-containing protein [Burkholderiaceae bacterium]
MRTEPWMAWGLGGTLLLSGAGLVALRRRPRAITPGSTV